MCAVSATIDTWRNPYSPNYVPWPNITPPVATDMLKVIELLERIDRKLDARDCSVAESDKQAFKAQLQSIAEQLQ